MSSKLRQKAAKQRINLDKHKQANNELLIICREQSETLSTNKGRFCNNREIDTLISKR